VFLIIDNYDSFVWNIYHRLPLDAQDITIVRNNDPGLEDLVNDPVVEALIVSPGPMTPREAGASNEAIRQLSGRGIPALGICLGHQCIGEVFGWRVLRHPQPTHGKSSLVHLFPSPLFAGLGPCVEVARYHSLHIRTDNPDNSALRATAWLDDGTVMAVEHRRLPVYGVQFHPESVLSDKIGPIMLRNFVRLVRRPALNRVMEPTR
jgi:para-aminobenzoate synthetase component II